MRWDDAFTAIFNEHYPGLCRYLDGMVGRDGQAQDLAQEALLRLYRGGPGRVAAGEERFWLYRVASNLAINELRRRRVRQQAARFLPGFGHRVPDPHEVLERSEVERRMQAAFDDLPPHQRAALVLRERETLSYAEIAQVLGVSLAKVKVDIHRAREALRSTIESGRSPKPVRRARGEEG